MKCGTHPDDSNELPSGRSIIQGPVYVMITLLEILMIVLVAKVVPLRTNSSVVPPLTVYLVPPAPVAEQSVKSISPILARVVPGAASITH